MTPHPRLRRSLVLMLTRNEIVGSRSAAYTFDSWACLSGGKPPIGVTPPVADTIVVQGRAFRCWRSTLHWSSHDLTAWFSDEVLLGRIATVGTSQTYRWTARVLGYGRAGKIAWGQRPDGLGLPLKLAQGSAP